MATRRSTTVLAGVSLTALVVTGCGSNDASTEEPTVQTPPASSAGTATDLLPVPDTSGGAFVLPGTALTEDERAFTYNEAAVPVGSTVNIESDENDGRTTVTLDATGLAPGRDFGVHVHTRRCGPAPADSGPHYQNTVDPAATEQTPSSDPAYANPQNEIWLDITTDPGGNAQASTTDWQFRPGEAKSVVVHDQHTQNAPGRAGMAGDRLACIDEDF
ncbi:superoxide dismutase family protein [Rhodococcus sp. NPDC057529]|uniref:superoxide dismutase family protein n=1 Tax=Rhodococcus sp. NPDC057529 TaxID=3346158 RepID=UPI00366FA5C6